MHRIFLISAACALIAAPLSAQIALPGVQVPDVGGVLGSTTDVLDRTTRDLRGTVEKLARDRLRTIDRLVRRHGDVIERDSRGAPARRGEILVMDASAEALAAGEAAGFAVLSREEIEGLGFTVVRLQVPDGVDLAEAEETLARLMPQASIAPDNLHFQSGATTPSVSAPPLPLAASAAARGGAPVGVIDGAPGKAARVAEIRGFAKGAPYPSNHGSAIASLLAHAGAGPIRVADVYGTDDAGGNALAMAKGLGWLVGTGSKVVTISLVGPRNPVLERAVGAAQRKGVVVVAAVGNGGPAAPPAYPASYDGVVAVTAVDGRRRALIEAGRALHLDYAAPGADIHGIDAEGDRVRLRGTSFATPLVAARAALAIGRGRAWRTALDAQAEDLGREGPDETYGRGLICGSCEGVPKKSRD